MEPHVHADGASFVFPFIGDAIVSWRIRVENSFTRGIKFENYAQLGQFFPNPQRPVFDQNCLLNSWKLFIGKEAIETSFHFDHFQAAEQINLEWYVSSSHLKPMTGLYFINVNIWIKHVIAHSQASQLLWSKFLSLRSVVLFAMFCIWATPNPTEG